jgi:hypothetical protein
MAPLGFVDGDERVFAIRVETPADAVNHELSTHEKAAPSGAAFDALERT